MRVMGPVGEKALCCIAAGMVTTKSVVNYKFCSEQGGGRGKGKLPVGVWLLFCMLSVLFGKLLSVIGYAISSVGICKVRSAGGRVAREPVYTTSKSCNTDMTVSCSRTPYCVT